MGIVSVSEGVREIVREREREGMIGKEREGKQ